jgi:hypothetical protein
MSEIWAALGGDSRTSNFARVARTRPARTWLVAFLSFSAFASLVIFVLFLILLGPSNLSAQTCAVTQLRVSVKDRSGTAVANAKVWLGDDSEAGARTTDDDGLAEFQNPGCGQVVVHAGSDGFKTVEEQLEIAGEEPMQTELTLAPESVQECEPLSRVFLGGHAVREGFQGPDEVHATAVAERLQLVQPLQRAQRSRQCRRSSVRGFLRELHAALSRRSGSALLKRSPYV